MPSNTHVTQAEEPVQKLHELPNTPPTPDRIGKDAVREALAKRTSMSTIAGGGKRPHVEIRFADIADAHALTDAILNQRDKEDDHGSRP